MTPTQAQALAIDRERTRVENRALRRATPVLVVAQREMTSAVLGVGVKTPVDVARKMVLDLTPALSEDLLGAAMTARLRALTIAQAVNEGPVAGVSGGGRGGFGGRLLRGVGGPGGGRHPRSINELAQRFIDRRLNFNQHEAEALTDGYGRVAARISGDLGDRALKAAEKAAAQLVQEPVTTKGAAALIRQTLSKAGLTTRNPYAVETIYRTSVQQAYAAGRWQANKDPAVQEILWGYEYSAVMDDRTTDLCSSLDGMKRPTDDPVWNEYTPPNHFGCRSTLIEVFNEQAPSKPSDLPGGLVIPEGFKVNWGELFRAA